MTRGGLSIDQKMVDQVVNSTIRKPEDFGKPISLKDLGFDITLDFDKVREFFSRGLCLDLQRRERGTTTVRMTDLKGALNSTDPLEYLRSKGYDDKILNKVFKG